MIKALLVSFLFSASAFAQQAIPLVDPPWIKEVAAARIVYSLPGMENIKARKDLVYKHSADEDLKLDVYQPLDLPRGGRRPAIIFVHGGALPSNLLTKPKEWGGYVSFGQLAAAAGFVGVVLNHRFHSWEMKDLSIAEDDLVEAIDYVHENAEELGIDSSHITLWTLSAGSVVAGSSLNNPAIPIRCFVFYYPIMDLEPLRKDKPTITEDAIKEFSPIRHLRAAATLPAAMFVVRAGREEPAVNAALDSFVKEALTKKAMLELSNHPTGQHGFDVLDKDDRSREIIKRTLEFIKAHG